MESQSEVEWKAIELPNIPIFQTKLPPHLLDYVWECVEQSKVDAEGTKHTLAGNIGDSFTMKDRDDYFWEECLKPLTAHVIDNVSGQWLPAISYKHSVKPYMHWWSNFQNQLEFNPLHAHGGILSFVIWLKVPTKSEEQHELPFAKGALSPAASDFIFTYSNILGQHSEYPIMMDPEMEGWMAVFPASLRHQVYPFFNCEEQRVSVAGNILWDVVESKDA
tara:strand:- start:645 stop:1304 length:660 start_codon:yes stop_codon:yes gene_type:complete